MTQTTDSAERLKAMHGRLGRIEAEGADSPASERHSIEEVYLRRARQLARRPAAASDSTTCPVLVFGLGEERYGIELSELAEVFPYRGCTAVPGAPPALLGVINVRGDIKAVADLRRLLKIPHGEDSATGYVVTMRRHGRAIGFRVDTVDEVRRIDPAQMVSGREGAAPIAASGFVKALVAGTVILLDTSAVLAGLGLGPT